MPPESKPTTATPAATGIGSFRVQMGDDKNRNFVWPMDHRLLRGRWSHANIVGVTMDERFVKMPDVPGILVDVDVDKRILRLMDPLAHPENKHLLEKAQAIAQQSFNTKCSFDFQPNGILVRRDLTNNQLKSVCWYVRRFLDARCCEVVRGRVPSADQCLAMPGSIAVEVYDSSPLVDHERPMVPYTPMRHDEEVAREKAVAEMSFDDL